MIPTIKIATVQSKVFSQVGKNGKEIIKLIRKASSKGAKVIHFCEGALSGYTKKQLVRPELIDFLQIRKELKKIKNTCKELDVWVILGCAHELSKGKRPHNSLYVISDEGEIINRYDKRKCSYNEITKWYTPGFEPCIFEINGIKFSCVLCIEINFPDLFIEAEKQDIHCVLFSSYSKDPIFGIMAQGYAASNNYWISMAIPTNESEILPSQFISPDGQIQSKCKRKNSSLIINEIDPENVKWHLPLRLAKPWRRIARKGKIYEEKRVDDERIKSKTIY